VYRAPLPVTVNTIVPLHTTVGVVVTSLMLMATVMVSPGKAVPDDDGDPLYTQNEATGGVLSMISWQVELELRVAFPMALAVELRLVMMGMSQVTGPSGSLPVRV
jgi:hypothetical protein